MRTLTDNGQPPSRHDAQSLGPYERGMNLRQVYESLPPPSCIAQVRILRDNTQAWLARWRLLQAAERTIDLSYFILKQDIFGTAFMGLLLRKARAGVHIRLLLDAQGTAMSHSPDGNDFLDTLVNTGNVELKLHRPKWRRAVDTLRHLSLSRAVASNHDKIFVIDGRYAISGGRNIAAAYFAHRDDRGHTFLDTDLELDGEDFAEQLLNQFEHEFNSRETRPIHKERINLTSFAKEMNIAYELMDAWLEDGELGGDLERDADDAVPELLRELRQMRTLQGRGAEALPATREVECRLLNSRTRYNAPDDVITQALVRLLQTAEREVFAESPYLMLSEQGLDLLEETAVRGVDVLFATNSPRSSDNMISQAFFLEQWPEIVARAPTLQLYAAGTDHTLHTKLTSIDGQLSLVGTYNLDPLSMATNSELAVAVWSKEFAQELTRPPREALRQGPPEVYRYTLESDAQGHACRDRKGHPVIAFGPADHYDFKGNRRLRFYRGLLSTATRLPGVSAFF